MVLCPSYTKHLEWSVMSQLQDWIFKLGKTDNWIVVHIPKCKCHNFIPPSFSVTYLKKGKGQVQWFLKIMSFLCYHFLLPWPWLRKQLSYVMLNDPFFFIEKKTIEPIKYATVLKKGPNQTFYFCPSYIQNPFYKVLRW